MKRLIFLTSMVLFLQQGQSQQSLTVWSENFDGSGSGWVGTPSNAWGANKNYYVSPPNSYCGKVPQMLGDTVVLTTSVYDLSVNGYAYAYLRFRHICKVSPSDTALIEYRTNKYGLVSLASWNCISATYYTGKAANFSDTRGFYANSYPEWKSSDSTAIPDQDWWKEELFDLSDLIFNAQVQFRFIIKRGHSYGSDISYGWLLDNFEFTGSKYEIKPPVVEFVSPFVKDTVYSTGPWEINARIKSSTTLPITVSYLKWTTNGTTFDSVFMTTTGGDLWKGSIPQFVDGTKVMYSVTGIDSGGNYATIDLNYLIKMPDGGNKNSVALANILSPDQSVVVGGQNTSAEVVIRNKGENTLTSCLINWTLNGNLQTAVSWNSSLPWDIETKVVLGNFISRSNQYDTLVIWVSMPNGIQDPITSDDTLTIIVYGCTGSLSGDYTIGVGKIIPSMNAAKQLLSICGVGGNVRLKLASGIYEEQWDFTNLESLMHGYTLSITSETGIRDDVVIQRSPSGAIVILNNTRNLVLDALTFNGSKSSTSCVYFTGACTNLVINNCALLSDTNSSSSSVVCPIYKLATAGVIDSFRLTNCLLEGGYYNAYFAGGGSNAIGNIGTNIVWDSNIFKSSYYSATSLTYTYFTSISHNTFLNRVTTNNTFWYGLYTSTGCHIENIIGNRIKQRNTGTTVINYIYAIYISNNNLAIDFPGRKPTIIANNEIIGNNPSTTAAYGIYLTGTGRIGNPPIYIMHNSVYFSGTGPARAIFLTSVPSGQMNIVKNNMLHVTGTTTSFAYPIYLGTAFNAAIYNIDANNMYSLQYVGYVQGASPTGRPDPTSWRLAIPTDKSSTKIAPSYINSTVDLQLNSYTDFLCIQDELVKEDILCTQRGGATSWGCYTYIAPQADAMIANIHGFRITGGTISLVDTLKAEIYNAGMAPLDTITIGWEINKLGRASVTWTGKLMPGEIAMVTLGTFTYNQGANTASVYLSGLGSKTDENRLNDTANISGHVCVTPLAGVYNIPGDFADLNAFVSTVDSCGAAVPITLNFRGQYTSTPMNFDAIATKLKDMELVITGDTIYAATGNAIVLGYNKNIAFKDITIKSDMGHCILFQYACTNISIRNCTLMADSAKEYPYGSCISKEMAASGIMKDIYIIGNRLDRGSYSVFLYGGTGTGIGQYGSNIIIDSNICTNSYNGGLRFWYSNVNILNNTVSPRQAKDIYLWEGIYTPYSNSNIIGNRVFISASNSVGAGVGIYASPLNNYNVVSPLYVANNEVRYLGKSYPAQGISVGGPGSVTNPIHVVHNSVYIGGDGDDWYPDRALHISGTGCINVKNNNVYAKSPITYPIYFDYYNSAIVDVDANNMYAPNYVGYVLNMPITTISEWQKIVTTDTRSISILPDYVDINNSLETRDWNAISCPQYPGITNDINKKPRMANTFMGAYTLPFINFDLSCLSITNVPDTGLKGQTINAIVNVISTGDTMISHAVFGWSRNGVVQTPHSWTFTPALNVLDATRVLFPPFAVQDSIEEIVIWIEQVNGKKDNNNYNDTVKFVLQRIPLVKFVEPFPEDIIIVKTFDVYAAIRSETGAPANPPKLVAQINTRGTITYDTIPMVQSAKGWTASVSVNHYDSKVIYSLAITDTLGNTDIIRDSVFVRFFIQNDTLVAGNQRLTRFEYYPVYNWDYYVWSRQLYLSREIGNEKDGVYITDFAWHCYNNCEQTIVPNQTCYFQIVDGVDSTIHGYEPYVQGNSPSMTLVWQGSFQPNPEFAPVITLNTPFYLPAGKNLIIQWEDAKGGYSECISFYYSNYPYPMERASYMSHYSIPPPGMPNWESINRSRVNVQFYTKKESEIYPFMDLAITKMTYPVEDKSALCDITHTPVEVVLENRGNQDFDFLRSNVHLYIETTTPVACKKDTLISRGLLPSKESMTVRVTSNQPVMYAGVYDFNIWLESAADMMPLDDTLKVAYASSRAALPIDENFTNRELPFVFQSKGMNTSATWRVMQGNGTGKDTSVIPQFGTGMLRFVGGIAAVSQLSTKEIDMLGMTQPILSFWYFHDTIPSEDYTNVLVTLNGYATTQSLLNVTKQNAVYGWKQYDIDLSPFVSEPCVILIFESMSRSRDSIAQYIDRIRIYANQNIALNTIFASPSFSECDFNNRDVQVVLYNTTFQNIDFSKTPTQINLRINTQNFVYPLQNGILAAQTYDTLLFPAIDFNTGTYNLTAFVMDPIDNSPSDDTIRKTIINHPDIKITAKQNTAYPTNCIPWTMTEIPQTVTIYNSGNLDVWDIPLVLEVVYQNITQQFLYDTLKGILQAGDSLSMDFAEKYRLPSNEEGYNVIVKAELACDVDKSNNSNNIYECINLDDIAIVALVNPVGSMDIVDSTINLEVTIKNYDPAKVFPMVVVTAIISDDVNPDIILSKTVTNIEPGQKHYKFDSSYVVAAVTEYTITVFITSVDNYPQNDTITVKRFTNLADDIALVALVNPPANDIDDVGAPVYLELTLENKSQDKTYPEVVVNAIISDSMNLNIRLSETLTNFEPGTINYKFTMPYIVPVVSEYTITVFVNHVDNNPQNDTLTRKRQTNVGDDIALIALVNPSLGSVDNVGEAITLEVTIRNQSPDKTYPMILANALISDGINFDVILTGALTNFAPGPPRNCKFASTYTVPAVAEYTITVFVNSVDVHSSNDTIIESRKTNLGINDYRTTGFILGQNIPNPAKDNTRIEYSLPEDGQVILTIYSITGQNLYIEKKDSYAGKNNIEFNTSNLADGVYYYSMEYKGERLVKRMTIRK